jgi:hypothetical protein
MDSCAVVDITRQRVLDHPPTEMEGEDVEDLAHLKMVDLIVCFPNFESLHVYNFDDCGNLFARSIKNVLSRYP